jgi:DNA-binding IclR family transcriptional regulator
MGKETRIITSAQKCLQILKYMAHSDAEMDLDTLTDALNINKSTMHHYLATLVVEGFAIQNQENKKYRIGPEAFRVGESYLRKDFPYDEMNKVLQNLSKEVGHNSYYFLNTDTTVSCILSREDNFKNNVHIELGTTLPLHASASGKVFLAFMTKKGRDNLIAFTGLPAYTDKTITDRVLLENEIIQLRLRGYALSNGEYSDFREIAVPVVGFGDSIVGAISVIGYVEKITDKEIKEIVAILTKYGKKMSDIVRNVVL